jgi:deoxyribonuclease-4
MSPPLGAHVSIAGGVSRAIGRGETLACETIQVFVKNASQWQGKSLDEDEVLLFQQEQNRSQISPVVAHASYLINLAATNPENLDKSRVALADELIRCDRLGIPSLVVHPGAHLGAGLTAGLELVAASLDRVLAGLPECQTRVLLENTAGQGTLVGSRLGELATIRSLLADPSRVGICIDTCHAFAAGYPIDSASGYHDFLDEVDTLFGRDELGCFHLNDSRHELGSRRDRHANLGQGAMSLDVFQWLIHEPSLQETPMILETPMGNDSEGHRRDLALLRGF